MKLSSVTQGFVIKSIAVVVSLFKLVDSMARPKFTGFFILLSNLLNVTQLLGTFLTWKMSSYWVLWTGPSGRCDKFNFANRTGQLPIWKLNDLKVKIYDTFEFFYNSSFPAKSWQDPASINREEQNKKSCPYWGLNSQPYALPTVLARNLLCVCQSLKSFIQSYSIDSRNEQSPTCEVVHEAKLTTEISFQSDSLLAQLAECETDDLEVVGSIPSKGNFFILLFSVNAGRILPRFGRNYRKLD